MTCATQWRSVMVSAAVAVLGASSAFAGAETSASQATRDVSIPFANHGGIRDWHPDRDRGLWVQDIHRNWYYATFMGPCFGLNFANSLGFDTRPMGTFDKFSAVVVPRNGRCAIQSLTRSDGPPAKRKANAAADAASASDAKG